MRYVDGHYWKRLPALDGLCTTDICRGPRCWAPRSVFHVLPHCDVLPHASDDCEILPLHKETRGSKVRVDRVDTSGADVGLK